jgi:anti-sigma regulatory factor (Ser/Thr protein kinase)
MEDLSLHILDIAENSITAGASKIWITIREDTRKNSLTIEIRDNGKGMNDEMAKNILDPFVTTRTTRPVGLGVPLLAQAAKESLGDIKVKTKQGKGTSITAHFQYNHIDRKPLGDIEKTIIVLIAAHPEIDFIFRHTRNGRSFRIDTGEIKNNLEGIPVNSPDVIKFIKDVIREWLNSTKNIILKKGN